MNEQRKSKIKFDRKYFTFNPNIYKGPYTQVLDTIVIPNRDSYDGINRGLTN